MEKVSPELLWILLLRHLRKAGYPVGKNQLGFMDWVKLGIVESILQQHEQVLTRSFKAPDFLSELI
jgi:hypothetical protein